MSHELKPCAPIEGAQIAYSAPAEHSSHLLQSAYELPSAVTAPYGPAFGNWHPAGGGIVELPMGGGPHDSGWIEGSPADIKGLPCGGTGFDKFSVPPGVTEVELGNPYLGHCGSSFDRREKLKDNIVSALPIGLKQLTRAALDLDRLR